MSTIAAIVRAARRAARRLAVIDTAAKNRALQAIADGLRRDEGAILAANAEDLAAAERDQLAAPLRDRLKLDAGKLRALADGVRAVADLDDPVGRVAARTRLDDGLELTRITCPLGVVAVIFESRPDAVPQIASLALKSGNALLLKGGREAAHSSEALVDSIRRSLAAGGEIPGDWIALLADREQVRELLAMDGLVDLVIPRGGNALVRFVQENTRIPVLGHAEGICHVYLDAAADATKSLDIVVDAKTQYPAACNAAETVLIHADASARLLPPLVSRLRAAGVELKGCARSRQLDPSLGDAAESDWRTEWSGLTLSLRIVDSLDEALDHIETYGSRHTDAIVTEDPAAAARFLAEVDSAGVYHNASTRFADGFRYGFGAEVGISTSKLHARGPVGLEGLVSYKYQLRGQGQVVASYSGSAARPFRHQRLT